MSLEISLEKRCLRCRSMVKLRPDQARTKYCYECRQQVATDSKRERRRATLRKMFSVCPVCDKRFVQGGQPKVEKQKLYCSDRCNKKAWKLRHRERNLREVLTHEMLFKCDGNYLPAMNRDNGKCRCGAPAALVHHIDNRGDKCTVISKNHALENLVSLCSKCHRKEHCLDWAFDGEALIIKCEAFRALLGVDTVRLSKKEVLI